MIMQELRKLGRNSLAREGAPLLGLYWLYSSIRWFLARESPYEAFENAFKVIQLEKQLGIFHEPTIQGWFVDHAMGVIQFVNAFYSFGYFPVLVLTGILLYRFAWDHFHTFKLTFLLGLGFALVCFSLFPLAPPRMLPEYGFVDTQDVYGSSIYNQEFALSFYNPYAAMPSLHFGWALLVGIMARSFNRRIFRVFGVLYPICMAFVVVTTGHHYFLDIVGGGIVVSLAYTLVKTSPRLTKEWTRAEVKNDVVVYRKPKPAPRRSPARRVDHSSALSFKARNKLAQRREYTKALATLLTRRGPPL